METILEKKDEKENTSSDASEDDSSTSGQSGDGPIDPSTDEDESIHLQQLNSQNQQRYARNSQEADARPDTHSGEAASAPEQNTLSGVDEDTHETEGSHPRRVDTEMNRHIDFPVSRIHPRALIKRVSNLLKVAKEKSPEEFREFLYRDFKIFNIILLSILYSMLLLWYGVKLGLGAITSAATDNPV